ncbi:hypothetical protein HNQ94_001599 [Salirhabdus euzebyi]|uniref:Uncharacterized protein n=1 Tax=Salirhabdus euzebyi TaxID=394506 RepID=A0A841Q408_9BACI|nr:hypothetical protein [Salirhabdus euzebyi]MBB6453151.1 hypothetical protein [Salirhabdus euzebyi]
MEKKNQKNDMPDFDSLDDRFIRNAPEGPIVAAKTNLDVKSNKDENPYTSKTNTDDRLFNEFFDE